MEEKNKNALDKGGLPDKVTSPFDRKPSDDSYS